MAILGLATLLVYSGIFGGLPMRRIVGSTSAALTCAAISTGAHAAVPIAPPTSSAGIGLPAPGEVLVNDFDGNTNAAFSFSGGTIRQGNVSGLAAMPLGDPTHYEAAEAGNSFIMQGPVMTSMSLYIGSLDTYNTIAFF